MHVVEINKLNKLKPQQSEESYKVDIKKQLLSNNSFIVHELY